MSQIYVVRFFVVGRRRFPLDMLRYDSCYPVTGADADNIHYSLGYEHQQSRDIYRVRLCHISHISGEKGWEPTYDRWVSFGWSVEEHSKETCCYDT